MAVCKTRDARLQHDARCDFAATTALIKTAVMQAQMRVRRKDAPTSCRAVSRELRAGDVNCPAPDPYPATSSGSVWPA